MSSIFEGWLIGRPDFQQVDAGVVNGRRLVLRVPGQGPGQQQMIVGRRRRMRDVADEGLGY